MTTLLDLQSKFEGTDAAETLKIELSELELPLFYKSDARNLKVLSFLIYSSVQSVKLLTPGTYSVMLAKEAILF